MLPTPPEVSRDVGNESGNCSPLLQEASDQLLTYWAGKLQVFDLPLCPSGPTFMKRVRRVVVRIPYGATASYGEIARPLGTPGVAHVPWVWRTIVIPYLCRSPVIALLVRMTD